MSSFIGLIILVGIVVNNAIVLIDLYYSASVTGAMRKGCNFRSRDRQDSRPILMTTLTTVLGMIPMALGIEKEEK